MLGVQSIRSAIPLDVQNDPQYNKHLLFFSLSLLSSEGIFLGENIPTGIAFPTTALMDADKETGFA